MISADEIQTKVSELNLEFDIVEKDYLLGWLLYGIEKSSISSNLVFKGGTSLSKIHFPDTWRLSEDLDYTIIGDITWEKIIAALNDEIPDIVRRTGNIEITSKRKPHTNIEYLQNRFHCVGILNKFSIKLDISYEKEIGEFVRMRVPQRYDYPEFSINVYTVETIMAEKLRAVLQRGKIRDYYDVWKLLKENKVKTNINELFLKKCLSKDVQFSGIEQFFPDGIEDILEPYKTNLSRLTNESIDIGQMLSEIRKMLPSII